MPLLSVVCYLACSLCLSNSFQVHPPGYVHQLFADAIVASVLHPALIQATATISSSSACATSASSLQASPSSHSSMPPKAIPPLPAPLDPAADPLADHDDVLASCTQPLNFFSAALSPPPFPYAFPKASSSSKRGEAYTGRDEKATSSSPTSRSGAVPFAPLSPPRGWAFGPDLAGKPAGWITPAERYKVYYYA